MSRAIDGPIPGENYTSDTRNYPWHRPPELTDIDAALDVCAKRLTQKKSAMGILTLLEAGATVTAVTDMFLTSGIGAGKWTPDFAILMAGPVARMIELLAKGAEIEYRMGIEDNEPQVTINFFKGLQNVSSKKIDSGITNLEEGQQDIPTDTAPQEEVSKAQGFMGDMGEVA
jgi:hypothetical protein